MSVSVCECTHCNASVVHFFVIWITVSAVGFSNISGISTPRLVALFTLASGAISNVLTAKIGMGFGYNIRDKYYNKVQSLSASDIDKFSISFILYLSSS